MVECPICPNPQSGWYRHERALLNALRPHRSLHPVRPGPEDDHLNMWKLLLHNQGALVFRDYVNISIF